MSRIKSVTVEKATSERAKELKAIFKKALGVTVTCKKGTGSMKCYYYISPYGTMRSFTDAEAKTIKAELIKMKGHIGIEPVTEDTLDVHFYNQVTFMLQVN